MASKFDSLSQNDKIAELENYFTGKEETKMLIELVKSKRNVREVKERLEYLKPEQRNKLLEEMPEREFEELLKDPPSLSQLKLRAKELQGLQKMVKQLE